MRRGSISSELFFAFQSMFISILVSRLEIAEFPDKASVGLLHKSNGFIVVGWGRANEEMLDIMWRCAAVSTDVEACILPDSALVGIQESTISGS